MTEQKVVRRIIAIDCCVHTLAALEGLQYSHITSVKSRNQKFAGDNPRPDLVVIGVAQFPIRRLFISQLRLIFPTVPMLLLRRESVSPSIEKECIRGEFILSDSPNNDDLETVRSIREIFPLDSCDHTARSNNYGIVREVVRLIVEKYSDPKLDLDRVAGELPVSRKRLSRILNQELGVSFRQLLRTLRIEEAKQMLASQQYSVKEVAMRVGFSDSHYFSRSFKELTGRNASEFRSSSPLHN